MKNLNPLISMLISSVIVGLSFIFVKFTLLYETVDIILLHRFLIALLCIIIVCYFKKINLLLNWGVTLKLFFFSLLYPCFFFLMQIMGLKFTSVSNSGILQAVSPVITVILAYLILKESIRKIQFIGIILSVLSLINIHFLNNNSTGGTLKGKLFILLSILAISLYQVFIRRVASHISPVIISFYILFFSSVNIFVYSISNHTFNEIFISLKITEDLLPLLYLSILSTFLTSYLTIYSVSKLPAVQVAIFNNLSTLITIISGYVVFKDKVEFYHWLCAFLIIVGVILVNIKSKNRRT